jgi:hypothetical protein
MTHPGRAADPYGHAGLDALWASAGRPPLSVRTLNGLHHPRPRDAVKRVHAAPLLPECVRARNAVARARSAGVGPLRRAARAFFVTSPRGARGAVDDRAAAVANGAASSRQVIAGGGKAHASIGRERRTADTDGASAAARLASRARTTLERAPRTPVRWPTLDPERRARRRCAAPALAMAHAGPLGVRAGSATHLTSSGRGGVGSRAR